MPSDKRHVGWFVHAGVVLSLLKLTDLKTPVKAKIQSQHGIFTDCRHLSVAWMVLSLFRGNSIAIICKVDEHESRLGPASKLSNSKPFRGAFR